MLYLEQKSVTSCFLLLICTIINNIHDFHSGSIYFDKKHLVLELCDSDCEVTCFSLLTTRLAVRNLDGQLKGRSWTLVAFEIQLSAVLHCLKLIGLILKLHVAVLSIALLCLALEWFLNTGKIMGQQPSLDLVNILAQSTREYSHCAQWNSPQNKMTIEKSSFEALHEGFILYFVFKLASRLTRTIFIEEHVTCFFFFLHVWKTLKLIFLCEYILDCHLLVWSS